MGDLVPLFSRKKGGRMLRDPCKKCIVEVVCSQDCEGRLQHDDYEEMLIYGFFIILGFCLSCIWGLMWFYGTTGIRGVIIGL